MPARIHPLASVDPSAQLDDGVVVGVVFLEDILEELQLEHAVEQQAVLAVHRLRQGLVEERTALANRLRGLLTEYGVVVGVGLDHLRRALPEILEDGTNGIPGIAREVFADAGQQLHELDARIAAYDRRLAALGWKRERSLDQALADHFVPTVLNGFSQAAAALGKNRSFVTQITNPDASAGVTFICVAERERTISIEVVGDEPGLKSVASTTASRFDSSSTRVPAATA